MFHFVTESMVFVVYAAFQYFRSNRSEAGVKFFGVGAESESKNFTLRSPMGQVRPWTEKPFVLLLKKNLVIFDRNVVQEFNKFT